MFFSDGGPTLVTDRQTDRGSYRGGAHLEFFFVKSLVDLKMSVWLWEMLKKNAGQFDTPPPVCDRVKKIMDLFHFL